MHDQNIQHTSQKSMTIDRIDGRQGYEPGNLRYATFNQQIANRWKNPRRASTYKSKKANRSPARSIPHKAQGDGGQETLLWQEKSRNY
jgi:hypothetical protein